MTTTTQTKEYATIELAIASLGKNTKANRRRISCHRGAAGETVYRVDDRISMGLAVAANNPRPAETDCGSPDVYDE